MLRVWKSGLDQASRRLKKRRVLLRKSLSKLLLKLKRRPSKLLVRLKNKREKK